MQVLGKKVSFWTIENKLHRTWTKNGGIQIIDMRDGYYQVVFKSEEDYKHAMFEGPWMVADHYLTVQRWRPLFLMSAEKVRKVAAWIRIPRLPIELYNEIFLKRIGMTLGTFLRVDRLTSIHSRAKFTRICVEIDLDKPLVSHIVVRGYPLYIEYEDLHSICFRCGRFGHKKDQCREILHVEDQVQVTEKDEPINAAAEVQGTAMHIENRVDITITVSETPHIPQAVMTDNQNERDMAQFGPWMIAKRKLGRRARGNYSNQRDISKMEAIKNDSNKRQGAVIEGSRFKVLLNAESAQQELDQESNENKERPTKVLSESLKRVEVVPETQLGSPSQFNSKLPSTQTQRVRNPRAGKNTQVGRPKEIKINAKKSFKKITPSPSKPLGKLEEVVVKEIKDHIPNSRNKEESTMLERMKQLQQQDVFQACVGWTDSLLNNFTHVDSKATAYVQKLQSQRTLGKDMSEGGNKNDLVVSLGEQVAGLQQGINDSKLSPIPIDSQ